MYPNILTGLSDEEVKEKQKNIKKQKGFFLKDSFFVKNIMLFLTQFKNPITLLLIFTVILALSLGDLSNGILMLIIVISTGGLSFVQEKTAQRAIEKLRSLINVKSDVLRNGRIQQILTKDVVTEDILILSAGDILPADAFILEARDLFVNEAVITGETFPCEKFAIDLTKINIANEILHEHKLFQGSNVVSGTAKAWVTAVDEQTTYGKISAHIQNIHQTAFEKGTQKFGYLLLQLTLFISVSILFFNQYLGKPLLDSLLFTLALTVGMAPELLPAILTVAMSSAAEQMAKHQVIVKKRQSILNFGEVNVLCSDKTGTITEGEITVAHTTDILGKDSDYVRFLAYLNAQYQTGFNNPIDNALQKFGHCDLSNYQKIDEIPYDFLRKRLSIVVQDQDTKRYWLITKGAFQQIFEISDRVLTTDHIEDPNKIDNFSTDLIDEKKMEIEKLYQKFSEQGFRALGLCYKEIFLTSSSNQILNHKDNIEEKMCFAGFILLYDPPKSGVSDIINRLKKSQISFKMITGDNALVAYSVGEQVGIFKPKVLTGKELEKLSPDALTQQIATIDIFAEIEPLQKENIIRMLQKTGNTVAYLGDGINDAAAIHAADVGLSVNNAVDIARESADVVLLENDLGVLEAGLMEGRKTFANTLKYLYINTSATFGSMLAVALGSVFFPFLLLMPHQILLINFLTDIPFLLVASDQVDEEVLSTPQRWDFSKMKKFILWFGLHSLIFNLLIFYILQRTLDLNSENHQIIFRTSIFLWSTWMQLLVVFVMRTRHFILTSHPSKPLIYSSLLVCIVALCCTYLPFLGLVPLNFFQIFEIFFFMVIYLWTAELLKGFFFSPSQRGKIKAPNNK